MGNRSSSKKKEKVKQIVRLLNLGISGSGKTTFAKQMKIITLGGFTEEEKDTHKRIVFHNIKLGLQELIKYAEILEIHLESENLKHSRFFLSMDSTDSEWSEKMATKAKNLWSDPSIQRTWKESIHYQLQVSTLDYFMENIDRMTAANYVPTNEDMLRTRQRTTGEHLTVFVNEKIRWELIDAGGQKPERAKWESIISTKESVNAIIYFVALDEYNMLSSEDPSKTKMQISFEAWAEILQSPILKQKQISLILFLNKVDCLTKKLSIQEEREDFMRTFPSCDDSLESATESVKKKFLDLVPGNFSEITSHTLCALDTSLMEVIFKAIKNTIFDSRVLTSGIKF